LILLRILGYALFSQVAKLTHRGLVNEAPWLLFLVNKSQVVSLKRGSRLVQEPRLNKLVEIMRKKANSKESGREGSLKTRAKLLLGNNFDQRCVMRRPLRTLKRSF